MTNPDRDSFVLSKGHAAAALYATVAEFGLLANVELARFAEDGSALEPGVTIAPDGAHLVLRGRKLVLDRSSPAGLHRPSADVLLHSIAESAGSAGVAVVLTGMGRDGAAGLGAVQQAGGLTVAQDEESSAVYGMPKEAARHGAQLILPLAEIARTLAAVVSERRSKPR